MYICLLYIYYVYIKVCMCVDERLKNKLVALTMTVSCTQVPRVTLKQHTCHPLAVHKVVEEKQSLHCRLHEQKKEKEIQITVRRHTIDHNQGCCAATIVHG
uniref:Putative secreted protein n=1 Tax=Amblyomma parvum TaxID=251391 RepID=A0A023FZ27_AMBPA